MKEMKPDPISNMNMNMNMNMKISTKRWHGLEPGGYHLVNVLLHCVATGLFAVLCGSLLGSHRRLASAVASLLFAAHPIHTEAVAGIVGRADVGAAVFFLLALLCYRRYTQARTRITSFKVVYGANNNVAPALLGLRKWAWLAATLLMAAASMLTKEHGVTVLAVCAIYDLLVHSKVKPRDVIATLCQVINKISLIRLASASHPPHIRLRQSHSSLPAVMPEILAR